MRSQPTWVDEVNSKGVERVARAFGLHAHGRLTCVHCGGWAAIQENDRIWSCPNCATTGTALVLAAEAFWKQTEIAEPTESDWANLQRMLAALALCAG